MDSNMGQSGITNISQLPSSSNLPSNISATQQNMQQNMPQNNIVLSTNDVVAQSNNQLQNPTIQNPSMINTSAPMQNAEPNMNMNSQAQNVEMQTNPNYNELINQLQHASAAGATSLPSRDIPMNTVQVANDVEVKPNYIPQAPPDDYIQNMQTPENLIHENNDRETRQDALDSFYNEFQLPLLIGILYFLFQLPLFKRFVKKFLPTLFGQDGNPNLYGYFFNSILFSSFFYILVKIINQLTISVIS